MRPPTCFIHRTSILIDSGYLMEPGTIAATVGIVRKYLCQAPDPAMKAKTTRSGGKTSQCLRAKFRRGRRRITRTLRERISSIRSNTRLSGPPKRLWRDLGHRSMPQVPPYRRSNDSKRIERYSAPNVTRASTVEQHDT